MTKSVRIWIGLTLVLVFLMIVGTLTINGFSIFGGEEDTEKKIDIFRNKVEIVAADFYVTGGAGIAVKKLGPDSLKELIFIFLDENGEKHYVTKRNDLPRSLDTAGFLIRIEEIGTSGKLEKVSVVPKFFDDNEGIEFRYDNPQRNVVNPETWLISWWDFNENFEDTVGENNGKNNGAKLIEDAVRGSVLDLSDGGTVNLGGITSFDQEFSVSLWYNVVNSQLNNRNSIISKSDGKSDYGWELVQLGPGENQDKIEFVVKSKPVLKEEKDVRNEVLTKEKINDGKWHNIIATFDGKDDVTIYLDGKFVSENSQFELKDVDNLDREVIIGGFDGGGGNFKGKIDDVIIFEMELFPEQANAIYNNLK
jgi:hypothetical protein